LAGVAGQEGLGLDALQLMRLVADARVVLIAGHEASGRTAVLASLLGGMVDVPVVVVSYWNEFAGFARYDLWEWAVGERTAGDLISLVPRGGLVAVDHVDCPAVGALVAQLVAHGLRVWCCACSLLVGSAEEAADLLRSLCRVAGFGLPVDVPDGVVLLGRRRAGEPVRIAEVYRAGHGVVRRGTVFNPIR